MFTSRGEGIFDLITVKVILGSSSALAIFLKNDFHNAAS